MNVQNIAPISAKSSQVFFLQNLVNYFGPAEVSGVDNTDMQLGFCSAGQQAFFRITLESGIRLEFNLGFDKVTCNAMVFDGPAMYLVGSMECSYDDSVEWSFGGFYGPESAKDDVVEIYG